ncbi:MAG TPA: efflux RND transporter periplasmic adaptor subunit [Gemmatimonadales bacterium]|nr:efflux RND transporter periplasmic adaptor subunit [Gemmatimonadales bacterium]
MRLGAARVGLAVGLAALAACKDAAAPPRYQAIAVAPRDIVVSANASGTVQPDTTVEVKTRAAGEVLEVKVETGQTVKRGTLLLRIDPRQLRNAVAQAEADLEAALAQQSTTQAQQGRAEELFKTGAITAQDRENVQLSYANAKAAVVRARVALENARIQLEDTDVRAPIDGTIIEKGVERGSVIASATQNVGGGTTLLKMADLDLVQITSQVDETDIGKVQKGQSASVTVDAYPNRPFEGTVLKIEPQAVVNQNVTTFPVRIRIDNKDGLLRPGMNADIEIHVGERRGVLAVPNAALRTQRDAGSAAQVLGMDTAEVRRELAQGQLARGSDRVLAAQPRPDSGSLKTDRLSGSAPSRRGTRPSAPPSIRPAGARFVVFVKRGGAPEPRWIQTGLTDLDYTEVLDGLTAGDSVLVLPSASMVQSQQEMRDRMNRVTGGGGLPGMRQQTGPAGGAAAAPAPAPTPR